MGRIITTKTIDENNVLLEVEINYQESLFLNGNLNNIHVFSEDAACVKTNMSQRGTNEATKYFLIPRVLRDGIDFESLAKCQRIDTSNNSIFVFVVKKK